jgi:hypothetical protein
MKRFARGIGAALALFGASIFPALGQSGPPPIPEPMYLLNGYLFQDTNWLSIYGDQPLSYTNIDLVPTWDGNGLQVDSSDPAWLSYTFESDGYPNLFLTNGTIRGWFLGNWSGTNLGGTGPEVWSRIIDVGQWTSNASYGWWSLYIDPAGCNIFFSAQSNNGVGTNYLSAPIAWDGVTWHEIELTYSASNTALYLDGALATNGPGISILPPPEALSNGFYVLSDQTGVQQFHGQADELWIFENQQTDTNAIASEYAQFNAIANPTPHFGSFGDDSPSFPGGGTNGGSGVPSGIYNPTYGSNQFWIEALFITNCSTCGPDLGFVLHGTTNGNFYELLTTTNLTTPINWMVEEGMQGAEGYTTAEMFSKNRPILFVRARCTDLDIISQPISQEVTLFDSVTFSVKAGGNSSLTYQWTLNGTNLPGATESSFNLSSVQQSDAGTYTVVVSRGTNSTTSSNAVLTCDSSPIVVQAPGTLTLMPVVGPRQDYTFKNGFTYYINSPVKLFGHTTIEGGTVIKFDSDFSSTLQMMGSLTCETEPYNPAILTVMDDDSAGESVYWASDGDPWTAADNATPYLDFSAMKCGTISNLMVRFADQGVATAMNQVDIWDSQFVACNSSTIVSQGATENFHNVLFAGCGSAVQGLTNFSAINAEQMTADVTSFWSGPVAPSRINLTNSILLGTLGDGSTISTQNVSLNPSGPVFQTAGYGNYYLAVNSLRQAGTTNISPRLLTELKHKTTWPAIALPAYYGVDWDMTFFPQAPRYTNGPPDLGYYYDALDYTASILTITGSVTVEPGTVFAVHNAYLPDTGGYTYSGFQMLQGSSFVSHGTPTQPNVFTAERMVQETPQLDFTALELSVGAWFDTATFVPEYTPVDNVTPPPTLDFRFCNFYLPGDDYQIWSGATEYNFDFEASPDSAVYLTMRDCAVHGGHINLGEPDPIYYPEDYVYTNGSVAWSNNLFDGVTINLDPTFYEIGADDMGLNVDLSLQAYNNLFRGGQFFHLEPIPASAGNWVFQDNFFDKVAFEQDILDVGLPLDYNFNGYWPLTALELPPGSLFAATLQPTTTRDGFTDGTHEQMLTSAPPYQSGNFGNFYLPTNTPLYHAGSTTADQLGLYHYTTQTNQVKETNDTVSIGLHYLAATNGLPMDADGDGIPDYVEDANGNGIVDWNETSWLTNMTDGVTLDPYNTIYDTVDLDADGVPGAQERLFGTNPLIPDNPLNLAIIQTNLVSGIVQIPLNISSSITNIGTVLMTVNGVGAGANIYQTNGAWVARWDTTQVSNGPYVIAFELPIDEDCDTVQANTAFVTVQNAISFPNDAPIAGSAIFINPQTIYTNGTWTMTIYDDQGNLFASLTGDVDGNGLFVDPNSGQEGVTVSILDGHGNPLPSQSYTMQISYFAAGQATPQATSTSIVLVKPSATNGLWSIAYMPFFPANTTPLEYQAAMMSVAINAVVNDGAPTYDVNSVIDSPLTADGYTPYQISNNAASWQQLEVDLANPQVRNFFYFGHFDGNNIGGTPNANLSISIPTLNFLLHNNSTTNQHPYRFVFMDGCRTAANKDLCAAFGIPTKTISSSNMLAKGLSPCAFVGWKDVKVVGLANSIYQPHVSYINEFWHLWPTTNPATGSAYTLKDALRYADGTNSAGQPSGTFFNNIVIYGSDDLTFQ